MFFCFTNIVLVSLPFGALQYEMLMEIGFDLVTLLMGLGLMIGIGISGANRTVAGGSRFWKHLFQANAPIRKIAIKIRIITTGEVKVQWAPASAI